MKHLFKILLVVAMICMVSLLAMAETVTVTTDGISYCAESEENAKLFDDTSLITLPTPTNLKWNVKEDGTKGNGWFSWDAVPDCNGKYKIAVYRDGETVFQTSWSGLEDVDGNGRVDTEAVGHEAFIKSGNYTFTIQALGDEVVYGNSAVATSSVYKFVCPDIRLDTPTDLEWIDYGVLRHSVVENAVGYAYIRYDENLDRKGINWSFGFFDVVDGYVVEDMSRNFEYWQEKMSKVYIKVIALTPDIEVYMNSNQSDFSAAVNFENGSVPDEEETITLAGDINCDGTIDVSDALLLLQYSMFPEIYPIEYDANVDFTRDGSVDVADAILVLQHSLFPELYPLLD